MNRTQLKAKLHPDEFRRRLQHRLHRDDGLRCALVALNCYRHRRAGQGAESRERAMKTARAYVAYARRAGFRGQVNAILDEIAADQGGVR